MCKVLIVLCYVTLYWIINVHSTEVEQEEKVHY
jgi:hypothetical protein